MSSKKTYGRDLLVYLSTCLPVYLFTCLLITCHFDFRRTVRTTCGFDGNGSEAVSAFLGRGVCRRRGFLQLVCCFHNQENDEGNDEEINNGLYKDTPGDDGCANC